jgi:hypothetical protein
MLYGDGSFYGDGWIEGEGALDFAAPLTSEGATAMDATKIERKQGDRLPYIREVLKDGNGAAINLSTATDVTLVCRNAETLGVAFTGTCAIVDALGGEVKYAFAASDLAQDGFYQVEFEITFESGEEMRIPTSSYRKMTVKAKLGS